MEILVPCGYCMGCRIMRKEEWAIRCMHEARMHDRNSFLTLTYAPEHLPEWATLVKEHHQLFMKRLREKLGRKVRFFMCGEYGEKGERPHYHYVLFGEDFSDDRFPVKETKNGILYQSPTLDQAWGLGHAWIGDVSWQSAKYVAGYCVKKIGGKALDEIDPKTGLKPYEVYDDDTGEVFQRLPEFALQSRHPGLGESFYRRYGDSIRRTGHVVLDGRKLRTPRYYYKLEERINAERAAVARVARRRAAKSAPAKSLERERGAEDFLRERARKSASQKL